MVARKPLSLGDAVKVDQLTGLRALRDRLVSELDVEGSQTAAVTRELRGVLKDIAALEKLIPKGSVVDDLASRRTKRIAKPKSQSQTAAGNGK